MGPRGPPKGGGPQFFPSPATNFFLFSPWGSSRGIVVAIQGHGPPKVCVWVDWGGPAESGPATHAGGPPTGRPTGRPTQEVACGCRARGWRGPAHTDTQTHRHTDRKWIGPNMDGPNSATTSIAFAAATVGPSPSLGGASGTPRASVLYELQLPDSLRLSTGRALALFGRFHSLTAGALPSSSCGSVCSFAEHPRNLGQPVSLSSPTPHCRESSRF